MTMREIEMRLVTDQESIRKAMAPGPFIELVSRDGDGSSLLLWQGPPRLARKMGNTLLTLADRADAHAPQLPPSKEAAA